MTTLEIDQLSTITGGVRGQTPAQIRERKQNLCLSPDPAEARRQYDVMVQHMGAGVWPRTIKAMGNLCGWPVPDGAKNAKPFPGAYE